MRSTIIRGLLAATAAAGLAIPATAGTIKVPKDHDTIQAAVDAASPGDKIVVSKGRYSEQVVIDNLDGLMLIGKKAIINGEDIGEEVENASTIIVTNSPNIVIQGFTFRWSTVNDIDIDENSPGVTIRKCRSRQANSNCVESDSDGLTIDNCLFTGFGSEAMDLAGDNITVTKNRGLYGDDGLVEIDGDNCVVDRNLGLVIEDGAMYDISGNNAVITKNKGSFASTCEIELDGDDGLIEGNTMRGSDSDLVDIDGDRIRVIRNRLSGADGEGIESDGDDVVIDGNTITDTADEFIDHDGDNFTITNNRCEGVFDDDDGIRAVASEGGEEAGSTANCLVENNSVMNVMEAGYYIRMPNGGTVRGNSARFCGGESTSDVGFDIEGTDILIENNSASEIASHGFDLGIDNSTVRNNKVKNVDGHGYRLDEYDGVGNNTVDRCQSIDAFGMGISNEAPNTTLRNSKFLNNWIDIFLDGASGGTWANDIESAGNKFQTQDESIDI